MPEKAPDGEAPEWVIVPDEEGNYVAALERRSGRRIDFTIAEAIRVNDAQRAVQAAYEKYVEVNNHVFRPTLETILEARGGTDEE